MTAFVSEPESIDSLERTWNADKSELERSQRVLQQLRAILLPLQQRCEELLAENKRRVAEAEASSPLRSRRDATEREMEAVQQSIEKLSAKKTAIAADIEEQRRAEDASKSREAASCGELSQAMKARQDLALALSGAEERQAALEKQTRSMVSRDVLTSAVEEAERLQEQLLTQEAEAARLRQALADSWAARVLEPIEGLDEGPEAQEAENLEKDEPPKEELDWLAEVQKEANSEFLRLQQLEKTEASLSARLKQVSEEKAELQSARVDFEDAGSALREAIASQSEGFIRRVGGLENARRTADQDRVKLIQECADMQARLDALAPELEGLDDVEGRHAGLQAAQKVLSQQSERLRDMNAALGVQLLADKGGLDAGNMEPVAEAVFRAVQLQQKLQKRLLEQDKEREDLSSRIRDLERGGIHQYERPPDQAGKALPSGPPGTLTALRGGLGRILNKV